MNTKVAKKNNKGFTLIELIVVIAIIAVLAAILAPQYLRYVEKSRVSVDCQAAAEIMSAARTAAADETIYDNLGTTGGTITWKNDNNKKTAKIAGSPKALVDEVQTTINGVTTGSTATAKSDGPNRKSSTLSNGICTFTVKITPGANGTVTVDGGWSGTEIANEASELSKKSGGSGAKVEE